MKIDDTELQIEKATTQIFARALNDLNKSTGSARDEVRTALLKVAKHISGGARQAASGVGSNLRVSKLKDNVASYTQAHPFMMLGGAFAAGVLISQVLRHARSKASSEIDPEAE